jgi:hypothetical protein
MGTFLNPPKYDHLPWDAIRLQYETTDVSLRMLAMQHGIASKTVLIRRIAAEGWTRQVNNIAMLLAVKGLAAAGRAGQAEPIDADTLREEADNATLLDARAMAQMHSARIRSQLALAGDIQRTGVAIMRRLLGVLEGTEAEVADHLKRLIAISPEGEKLSSLIKAVADATDRAVIMERRALGMDALNMMPNASATPDPVYSSEAAISIVKQMDVTLAMRLRQLTSDMLEARRDQQFVDKGKKDLH